ncbi:hypothetical protein E2C01_094211 [Portunus trituberculatus]|uniref:Uncharacterized protein n=1 Tax=Portunus trituberculatus TaxID=210409 RepID=A0A5B7K073_PORTR|nr:hypothetical protein [Portunus trituberculatus]
MSYFNASINLFGFPFLLLVSETIFGERNRNKRTKMVSDLHPNLKVGETKTVSTFSDGQKVILRDTKVHASRSVGSVTPHRHYSSVSHKRRVISMMRQV